MNREDFEVHLNKLADKHDAFMPYRVPSQRIPYIRKLPPPLSSAELINAPDALIPYLSTISSCLVFGYYVVNYKPPFEVEAPNGAKTTICDIGEEGCGAFVFIIVKSDSPQYKVGSVYESNDYGWNLIYLTFEDCAQKFVKEHNY